MKENPEKRENAPGLIDSVYNNVSFVLVGPATRQQAQKMTPIEMRIGDATLAGFIDSENFQAITIGNADVSIVQKANRPLKYRVKVVAKDSEAALSSFDFFPA